MMLIYINVYPLKYVYSFSKHKSVNLVLLRLKCFEWTNECGNGEVDRRQTNENMKVVLFVQET